MPLPPCPQPIVPPQRAWHPPPCLCRFPAAPQISIVDGRKFEVEGDGEDAIERCELLANKQGQPLLAHGRSGSYTDTKRVMVPMIHGQALLPDLKITDSSEALLTGRAPPFRLAVRAVHRSGEPFVGVNYALSDPFVVRRRVRRMRRASEGRALGPLLRAHAAQRSWRTRCKGAVRLMSALHPPLRHDYTRRAGHDAPTTLC